MQVAGGGYDIAWKIQVLAIVYGVEHRQQRQLSVERHRRNVSGNNTTLEALETTFNQDLNGDGTSVFRRPR